MSVNLGAFALAKNGIGRINEIGRLKLDQQPHLFDAMEEGVTDMVKYGFPANIECHVSVLATANPISNKWKNEDKISIEEFPVLLQIADRFDLIYVFRENTEEVFLDHYTKTRIQVAKNYKQGIYEGDLEKVQKHIAYARTFSPKIGDDVELLLRHFLKQMAKSGVDGLFRKFDSLLRVSIGIARLKLKSVVDVEDANEAMQMFQFMLSEFKKHVGIPVDPRDTCYYEMRQIVKETYNIVEGGIEFSEAAKKVSERNSLLKGIHVKDGNMENWDNFRLEHNSKLKPILDLLRKDPHILIVKEHPIVMKWDPDPDPNVSKKGVNDVADVADVYFQDPHENFHVAQEMKGGFEEDAILQWGSQKEASATSATSARIYKASWTGDVWACRYCGLKGDRPSMEKHDCPVVKKEGVQR